VLLFSFQSVGQHHNQTKLPAVQNNMETMWENAGNKGNMTSFFVAMSIVQYNVNYMDWILYNLISSSYHYYVWGSDLMVGAVDSRSRVLANSIIGDNHVMDWHAIQGD